MVRRSTRLVGISLSYFMVLLDTTVLAVAQPDMIASLHTGVLGIGWVTTVYTTALASALVLGGAITDRRGAHSVFVAGSLGFGLASLGCALAPGLGVLLVCRVLLGLLAAAVIPSSLRLIAGLYPEPAARSRAISMWAAISGSAMAAGPVIGGLLVALDGWRAVFVINAPVALLVLFLCRDRVDSPRHHHPISWLPHLGLAATLAIATLAVTRLGERTWTPAVLLGLAAAILGAGTTMVDRRAAMPLIPGALRGNRAVWIALGWGAVANYALTTVLFSLPLLLDANPAESGLTLLPMTLLVGVNPLLTGRLIAARGPLLPIRMGLVAFPSGLCLVGFAMTAHDRPAGLGAGLLLCGLGVSWTLPALIGFAVDHTAPDVTGTLGGILNASRQVGATVAAATASVTLARHGHGSWAALPFLVAASICIAGLAAACIPRLTGVRASSSGFSPQSAQP